MKQLVARVVKLSLYCILALPEGLVYIATFLVRIIKYDYFVFKLKKINHLLLPIFIISQ